ncbi:hypothetical protein H6770_01565 [Candidatus Peribacteria bacterium]|nr:hypothetical protein [Candidatus Peribacteria bacterium]
MNNSPASAGPKNNPEATPDVPEQSVEPIRSQEDLKAVAARRVAEAEEAANRARRQVEQAEESADAERVHDAEKSVANPDIQKALSDAGVEESSITHMLNAVAQLSPQEQRELLVQSAALAKELGIDGIKKIVAFYRAGSDAEKKNALNTLTQQEVETINRFTSSPVLQKLSEFTSKAADETSGGRLRDMLSGLAEKIAPFLVMLSEFMAEFKKFFKDIQDAIAGTYNPDAVPTDDASIDSDIQNEKHLDDHRNTTTEALAANEKSLDAFEGDTPELKQKNQKNKVDTLQDQVDAVHTNLTEDISAEDRKAAEGRLAALQAALKQAKEGQAQLDTLLTENKKLVARLATIEQKLGIEQKEPEESAASTSEQEKDSVPERSAAEKQYEQLTLKTEKAQQAYNIRSERNTAQQLSIALANQLNAAIAMQLPRESLLTLKQRGQQIQKAYAQFMLEDMQQEFDELKGSIQNALITSATSRLPVNRHIENVRHTKARLDTLNNLQQEYLDVAATEVKKEAGSIPYERVNDLIRHAYSEFKKLRDDVA